MPKINFRNKVTIITGASQGLGFEIAKSFAKLGSNLVICARNQHLLKKSLKKLKTYIGNKQKIIALKVDISNQRDTLRLVKKTLREFKRIDILINNAGVLGPKGKVEEINWKKWIRATEINIFGSVLMCRAVLPYFKKVKRGKIIQLSGAGALNPMPMFSAYAASKAAIVRFSDTLAEEVKKYNIQVNSVAAGAINTKMLKEIIRAGPKRVGSNFYKKIILQKKTGGLPFKVVTELIIFLSSSKSKGITGKIISPKWDNWKNWSKNMNKIISSDVYTLRRIKGIDRGYKWGDN